MINAHAIQPPSSTLDDSLYSLSVSMLELSYSAARNAEMLMSIGYSRITDNGWRTEDVFIFDIYRGNLVHTTELLESPLEKGNHAVVEEFSRIQLSVLNDYDLIITKLFRGTAVDFDYCMARAKGRRGTLDLGKLVKRFRETASYALGEDRISRNLSIFLERLEEG